jgi:hypothetical protein
MKRRWCVGADDAAAAAAAAAAAQNWHLRACVVLAFTRLSQSKAGVNDLHNCCIKHAVQQREGAKEMFKVAAFFSSKLTREDSEEGVWEINLSGGHMQRFLRSVTSLRRK